MFWQIVAVLGYAAGMAWATALAPQEARLPSIVILHGAFALGWLCRDRAPA